MGAHIPRKRFGQHFLVDSGVLSAIVAAIAPRATDRLVEIGPGLGALTIPLLAQIPRLTAIELDRDVVVRLRNRFPAERLELFEADAKDRLARPHEPIVAGDVVRRESRDLGAHGLGVATVGEGLPVMEADAIEGIARAQLDVIRELAPAQRPEFLEQEWRRDDGGARVERDAILSMNEGPPSRRFQLLQHGDALAAPAEPNRGRQAPKSAADNHGSRPRVGRRNQGFWALICQHE